MNKKPDHHDIEEAVREIACREQSLSNRETWIRAREIATGERAALIVEREQQLEEREHCVLLRERAVQARATLLAASELEAASGEDMRTIDLAEVVAKAVDAVRRLVGERGHVLRVSVASSLWVHGNRDRLGLFLADLLIDSAQSMQPGGWIEVTGERDGNRVRLLVEDNDVGVRADVRLPLSPS